jgi:hypothetical protein
MHTLSTTCAQYMANHVRIVFSHAELQIAARLRNSKFELRFSFTY